MCRATAAAAGASGATDSAAATAGPLPRLRRLAGGISAQDAASLVFIEPTTSAEFHFSHQKRAYTVRRTGFAISHGRVITSTVYQGRTMRDGVIIDAGRKLGGAYPTKEHDFWLHLYPAAIIN